MPGSVRQVKFHRRALRAAIAAALALLCLTASGASAQPGQVFSFGNNKYGQLGSKVNNGTSAPSPTPGLILLPTPAVRLAAGEEFSLALTSTGELFGFGRNNLGQVGSEMHVGTDQANPIPGYITLPGASGQAAELAAGSAHGLVLTTTGQLFAFGQNLSGQLGGATNSGTETPNPTPTIVSLPGATGPVAQVAAGGRHTLALTTTDQLYAFGANSAGQLGNATNNGTGNPNPTPTLVELPGATGSVAQIAGGGAHSLVLTSTGQLYAFGANDAGQLGYATNSGTSNPNPTPALVSLPGAMGKIVQISAGAGHSVALTSSGQVYTFGANRYGQLGRATNAGTSEPNPTPALVSLAGAVGSPVQVIATESDTYVITSSGQLFAFGVNDLGQLGGATNSGTIAPNATPSLVAFPFGTTIDTIGRGPQGEQGLVLLAELSVLNSSLPAGQVGVPYHATAASSGGTGAFAWRASGLPPGLSIAPDGEISGTPTSAGASSVRLSVTDIFGLSAASAAIPMTIAPAAPPPAPPVVPPKSPTTAQIKASLLVQLGIAGKAAKIAALSKRRSYSYSFRALTAGTLTIGWYFLPKGAHLSKRTPRPVLFAGGGQSFSTAGTKSVTLTLTSRGRQLLRHHGHLGITAKGIFTPAVGPPITATKPIKLTR